METRKIKYRAGEIKRQSLRVFDREGGAVVIRSATWELHSNKGDALIDRGSCTVIDGNVLTFLLGIDTPGCYHIVVTYLLGSEIRKKTAEVICDDCGR